MAITVRVDIVSADHAVMGGEATFVVVPTTMGELGLTPRHTQLLAELKAGEVRVTDDKGTVSHFFVSGGVLEVQPHAITILADSALREEDARAVELVAEEARLKALESRIEIGTAAVAHPLRVAPVDDETGLSQRRHVARHARLRGAEFAHQLANAVLLAVPQQAERPEAGGVGQGRKQVDGIGHVAIRLCVYQQVLRKAAPDNQGIAIHPYFD